MLLILHIVVADDGGHAVSSVVSEAVALDSAPILRPLTSSLLRRDRSDGQQEHPTNVILALPSFVVACELCDCGFYTGWSGSAERDCQLVADQPAQGRRG